MNREHSSEVREIILTCNLSERSDAEIESEVLNPNALLLVAVSNQKVLGFISARLIKPVVEILDIAVELAARRRGIGNSLLRKSLEIAGQQNFTESWLEVRESNRAAVNFYLSHRYEIVGRRRNYYSNPIEDAILMTLVFSDDNPKK